MTGTPERTISVLVAEDSPTQREAMIFTLEETGGFNVVGIARDGLEAISETERLRPDIVLMDCHMPHANGFEAARAIMTSCPTPIVMVSSTLSNNETAHTFDAIKAGALAFVIKPGMSEDPADAKGRASLIQTLRLMSEIKVVGRRVIEKKATGAARKAPKADPATRLIAIAGSTGAPGIIAEILSKAFVGSLPPILIVQHMSDGFVPGFARWLSSSAGFPVRIGEAGMVPMAGEAYLAPDDSHMGLDGRGRIMLSDGPAEEGFRPSADFLFRSVSKTIGAMGMGILLTGMGRDGASGLMALRQVGGLTLAQDEASCVVFGMPREAIELGAVAHVLTPAGISQVMASTAKNTGGPRSGKQ